MTLREDQIAYQNGDHGIYGVVDKPDFVLIIPFDGDGRPTVRGEGDESLNAVKNPEFEIYDFKVASFRIHMDHRVRSVRII